MLPKRSKGGGGKEGLICGGMNGTLRSSCSMTATSFFFFAWHRPPFLPPIAHLICSEICFVSSQFTYLLYCNGRPPFYADANPDLRDGLRSSVMLTQNSVPLTAFLQRATAVKLAACFHPPTPDSPSHAYMVSLHLMEVFIITAMIPRYSAQSHDLGGWQLSY